MIKSTFFKSASVEELREQLAETKRAREEAQRAVTAAEAAFDEAGDLPTSKVLGKAREVLRDADEHVARAERLLAAGEEREAAEKRKELEALFEELEAKTSDAATTEAGRSLAEEEVDLLVRLAKCRLKRKRIRDELRSAECKREALAKDLGIAFVPMTTWDRLGDGRIVTVPTSADNAASPELVRQGLQDRISKLATDDPLRPFLFAAEPTRADYTPSRAYFFRNE